VSLARLDNERCEREVQTPVEQHGKDSHRLPAEAVGVLGAARDETHGKAAVMVSIRSAMPTHMPSSDPGSASPAKRGVVLGDRRSDPRVLAREDGVLAAHDALKLGELATTPDSRSALAR